MLGPLEFLALSLQLFLSTPSLGVSLNLIVKEVKAFSDLVMRMPNWSV